MSIRILDGPDAALALPALRELRPNSTALRDETTFATHLAATRAEGYRLAGAFEEGRAEASAAAGYRAGDKVALNEGVGSGNTPTALLTGEAR